MAMVAKQQNIRLAPFFYFEGLFRKSSRVTLNVTLCKHGELGRCRLETPGIQSPIKKIRSGSFLCMTLFLYDTTDCVSFACVCS